MSATSTSLASLGGRAGKTSRRTTVPDEGAAAHPDRVERRFVASAPNLLWIAVDITYVATWSGFVYSACPGRQSPQSTGRQRTSMPLGSSVAYVLRGALACDSVPARVCVRRASTELDPRAVDYQRLRWTISSRGRRDSE